MSPKRSWELRGHHPGSSRAIHPHPALLRVGTSAHWLNVKGLVRNRRLAKSISDAGWYTFRVWDAKSGCFAMEYFGRKYGKVTVAVAPHYTSQNCSNCGQTIKKSLSCRTHVCNHCGYVADRDVNAAINILKKGLSTAGHAETYTLGESRVQGYVGAILRS